PEMAPAAPAATRAKSSKNRLWLCIAGLHRPNRSTPAQTANRRPGIPACAGMTDLFRRLLLRRGGPGPFVPVDLFLDCRRRLSGKVDVVVGGVIVAPPQEVAAVLEMRVHEAGHQLVMPLGGFPIAPVLRQFAQHAKPARALDQPLDIGNRVVRGADAGG